MGPCSSSDIMLPKEPGCEPSAPSRDRTVTCGGSVGKVICENPCSSVVLPARSVQSGIDVVNLPHAEFDPPVVSQIERVPFNFEAHDAIPRGWEASDETPPGAFGIIGRDACVIRDVSLMTRSVLLATPSWSIKPSRCDWLIQQFCLVEGLWPICRLYHCVKIGNHNTSVLMFRYPGGVPLHRWISHNGRMDEDIARQLCRDLLCLTMELRKTPITFWGLLLPSMVFVDEQGSLVNLLPLSCILSWHGVRSVALGIDPARLPPEMASCVASGILSSDYGRSTQARVDVFSVAAVILEAVTGDKPDTVQNPQAENTLSETANDFFKRILCKDPLWRLSIEDAIVHPWLRVVPLSARVHVAKSPRLVDDNVVMSHSFGRFEHSGTMERCRAQMSSAKGNDQSPKDLDSLCEIILASPRCMESPRCELAAVPEDL